MDPEQTLDKVDAVEQMLTDPPPAPWWSQALREAYSEVALQQFANKLAFVEFDRASRKNDST
jgi:hypothetical protein